MCVFVRACVRACVRVCMCCACVLACVAVCACVDSQCRMARRKMKRHPLKDACPSTLYVTPYSFAPHLSIPHTPPLSHVSLRVQDRVVSELSVGW